MMARGKSTKEPVQAANTRSTPIEPKIATKNIITSKSFQKDYQYDFMKALLVNDSYTVSEARAVMDNYFNRKVV